MPQQHWLEVYENLMIKPPGAYDKECDHDPDGPDFEDQFKYHTDNHAKLSIFGLTNTAAKAKHGKEFRDKEREGMGGA